MTTEAQVLKSVAVVTTPKAESYLAQLCKHFAHKIPATHEVGQGRIDVGLPGTVVEAAASTCPVRRLAAGRSCASGQQHRRRGGGCGGCGGEQAAGECRAG